MKRLSNQSIFYTAIVAVFSLLLFLLATLASLWTQIDDSRAIAAENITWSAANTDIDLLKLTNRLRDYSLDPTPEVLASVLTRYELLISRVDLLTEGELGQRIRLVDGGAEIATDVTTVVSDVEDDIYALSPETAAKAVVIARRIDALSPRLFRVLVDVSNATSSRIAMMRVAFEGMLSTAIICLTLMSLISVGVAVMLINERKRREIADAERDKALREEARASKAKSEFLSSMSHELRTPLNAILGFGQLLDSNKKNPLSRSQQKAVNRILSSGEHLLQLINQVLDLSKIEAGQENLRIEEVPLDPIVLDTMALMTPMAAKHGVSLELSEDSETATVMADRLRLKQIVMNLVSNAIKYNRDHGHVTVTIKSNSNEQVELIVADTGMGIPEEYKEDLFRPFSRLGNELGDVEGTGIGLAISRSLLISMSGNIDVRSTEGVGSEFIVTLPGKVSTTDAVEAKIPRAASNTLTKSTPFKILYVEDNPTNIVLMEDVVDVVPNARLISAHNAELGIEIAEAENPDIVLMDINLPGMNGLEALAEFRRRPTLSQIPVVAVTGDPTAQNKQDSLDAGFEEFIMKPFDLEHLMSVLHRFRPDGRTTSTH